MEYLRSLGSRNTPREPMTNGSSSVSFGDHEDSRSNSSPSDKSPVEDLDPELQRRSQAEIRVPFSNEPRKDFLLSPAKPFRTTFVPVDELPLNPDFGAPGRTYLEERQILSVGMSGSRLSQLPHDPAPVFGDFPILHDAFGGGGDRSVRRLSGIENVTTRETKRPKERNKDKEYRRLTLTRSDMPSIAPPVLDSVGARPVDDGLNRRFYSSPP